MKLVFLYRRRVSKWNIKLQQHYRKREYFVQYYLSYTGSNVERESYFLIWHREMSAKIELKLLRCTFCFSRDRDSVFIYFPIWMSIVNVVLAKYIYLCFHSSSSFAAFYFFFSFSLLKVYISALVCFCFASPAHCKQIFFHFFFALFLLFLI